MKITYKGEYALKAILDLCDYYGKNVVVTIGDISRRRSIPEKYLEQIMLILRKSGYVNSKRGIGGGFMLAKSPDEITVGEIVRLIDGPIEPVSLDNNLNETIEQQAFKEVWVKVTHAIAEIVDDVTFQDMMSRCDELRDEQNSLMYHI